MPVSGPYRLYKEGGKTLQAQKAEKNPARKPHAGRQERQSNQSQPFRHTEQVEMADIFRRSEDVGPVVDRTLRVLPGLKTIWTQMGVRNDVAAARARAAGVAVEMNRCPAIEMPRLGP